MEIKEQREKTSFITMELQAQRAKAQGLQWRTRLVTREGWSSRVLAHSITSSQKCNPIYKFYKESTLDGSNTSLKRGYLQIRAPSEIPQKYDGIYKGIATYSQ